MSKKYMHLLSPIKIGNVIFKNRLITPPSNPYFAQGGEPYSRIFLADLRMRS